MCEIYAETFSSHHDSDGYEDDVVDTTVLLPDDRDTLRHAVCEMTILGRRKGGLSPPMICHKLLS